MPHVGAMWPLRWSGQSECIDKAFIEKNFQGTLEANLHSIYLKSKNGKPRALRYFRKRGSRVYLEAANPDYRSIVPREKLTVTAVVIAVIRKYY